MQIKMPCLRHRNLKPLPNVSNDRADDAAFLFERVHISQKQINLQNAGKHVLFRLFSD